MGPVFGKYIQIYYRNRETRRMKSSTQCNRSILSRTLRSASTFDEWCPILIRFVVVFIAIATPTTTNQQTLVVVSAFSSSSFSSFSNKAVKQQCLPLHPSSNFSNKYYTSFQNPQLPHSLLSKQQPVALPLQQQQQRSSSLYSFFQNKNDPDTEKNGGDKNYIDDDDDDTLFENDPRDKWYFSSMATTMVCTQAGFIPIGVVLATVIGIDLNFLQLFHDNNNSMLWLLGVLSTIPLVLFAAVLDIFEKKIPAIQEVSEAVLRSVYSLLGGSFKPLLAVVIAVTLGIMAGVGEEILFRGILQESIYQQHWTTNYDSIISIVLSSIIFGLVHAVTPLYVVFATIASLYFGTLYTLCDGDLTIPIMCHSIYDIGALLYAHYTISQLSFPELQQLIIGGSEMGSSSGAKVE